jgi:hypothetical protein
MDQLDSSIGFLFWFFPSCAFLPFVLNVRFVTVIHCYNLCTCDSTHCPLLFLFSSLPKKQTKNKKKPNSRAQIIEGSIKLE